MVIPWFDIFVGSYLIWVLLACMPLLLERRSPTATLSWIFAFIAIPFVSGVYYMMFGPRRLKRRRRRYGIARGSVNRKLGQAGEGPARPDLTPDAAALAQVARKLEQGEPTFASAVRLLNDAFWRPLREAGGQVIAFNPVRFLRITFGNFRTHRKIAVCDGITGFLGGINLHNLATATRSGKNAWRDQHTQIDGEPVYRLPRLFPENWNYSRGAFNTPAHNPDK